MRTLEDWIAQSIVLIGALVIALSLSTCTPAHAEEVPEAVYQTIAMESANQSAEGQAWVARVIQERAIEGKTSLLNVVFKPKAFSCWNSRKQAQAWLDKHYDHKTRQNACNAWNMASGMSVKPTHYHAINVKPYWAKGHKPMAVIGNHVFYGGIK